MITAIIFACYMGYVECRKPTHACAVDSTSNVCLNERSR